MARCKGELSQILSKAKLQFLKIFGIVHRKLILSSIWAALPGAQNPHGSSPPGAMTWLVETEKLESRIGKQYYSRHGASWTPSVRAKVRKKKSPKLIVLSAQFVSRAVELTKWSPERELSFGNSEDSCPHASSEK